MELLWFGYRDSKLNHTVEKNTECVMIINLYSDWLRFLLALQCVDRVHTMVI